MELPVDADTLWRAIGSFQQIDEWHPLLARVEGNGEQPGAVRTATGADGSAQVERLLAIDPAQRRYRYVMESGALPVRDYRAELRVLPDGDGLSTVRWTSDFETTAGDPTEAVEAVRGFFAAGLQSLTERYA